MTLLSIALVKRQAATAQAVEDAVARQVSQGGDLLTNLLELGATSERDLREVLHDVYGLPVLAVGPLPPAEPSTLRLVPADMAERYALVPLDEEDGTLTVAVSEPLDTQVVGAIEDTLGVTLRQRVALSVRIRQALARDYGAPLDRRSARLVAALEGRPDPSPSVRPARSEPAGVRSTYRSPSAPPSQAPADHRGASFSRAGRLATGLSLRPSSPAPGYRPRSRHIGPYASATARVDLRVGRSRDEVVGAFFDFVAQYFEYSALFVVHGDLAEGWDAHGPGTDRGRINTIGVPLDLPSVLATARNSGTWHLARLGSSTLDQALARDLGRQPEGLVFVMPICVRNRCVMLLYGDHGDSDVDPSRLDDVIVFVADLSAALERILLERKRGRLSAIPAAADGHTQLPHDSSNVPVDEAAVSEHRQQPPVDPKDESHEDDVWAASPLGPLTPVPEVTMPEVVAKRRAAHKATLRQSAIAEALRPARTISINPPGEFQDPEVEVGVSDASVLDWDLVLPDATLDGPPRRATPPWGAMHSAPSRNTGTLHGLGDEWEYEDDEGESMEAIPLTRRPGRQLFGATQLPPEVDDTPAWMVGDAAAAASTASSGLPSEQSEQPAEHPAATTNVEPSSEQISGPEKPASAPRGSSEPAGAGGDQLADNTAQAIAYSPRAPWTARILPEIPLPSVMVDVAKDCRALVARVLEGDREAADHLVAIGEAAIASVASRLPGPVSAGSQSQLGDQRASQCGLLLEVLARIGRPSVPFIAVRAADSDPQVRTWATRLLGELPSPEAVRSVVPRLSDKNSEVRAAALAAARMLLAHSDTQDRLSVELEQLVSSALSKVHRLAGVRALVELRHAAAVPVLLSLVADEDAEIAEAAHDALVRVTRQDHGRDEAPWRAWWEVNQTRHRIEWLIDGLMHESVEIRREAGDELKTLTREYFGYYDDLPPGERAEAQQRYREWWEDRGRAKFT